MTLLAKTPETTPTQVSADVFQTGQVLPIAGAHFIHDIYTAFIAPLLPSLIEKLSLSLTQAGGLNAFLQLPSLLSPFIGYLADKSHVRYFIILAPAVTGTLVSSMGFAPTYFALAVLFFTAGISSAAFHAPAPAMITRVSGRKIGLGMSLFMAAGELARTLGPLLAVWIVSRWTLDGLFASASLGWAASLVLYFRLRQVNPRLEKPGSLRTLVPQLRRLFLPMALALLFIDFMLECLTTFLPTYLQQQGAGMVAAGSALSVLFLAGTAGALAGGPLSDRLGRKRILLATTLLSVPLMLLFLRIQGALLVPTLLALGFITLSRTPIIMSIVQEQLPDHRATGNGLYMVIAFLLRPVAGLAVGYLGDHIGLQAAFLWSALASLLAIPFIWLLPEKSRREAQ